MATLKLNPEAAARRAAKRPPPTPPVTEPAIVAPERTTQAAGPYSDLSLYGAGGSAVKIGRDPTTSQRGPSKKKQRKLDRLAAFKRLAQIAPDLFACRDMPVPLAIGIRQALLDAGATQDDTKVIGAWVGRRSYLQQLTPGAQRFDIAGEPCGSVTPEQALRAAKQLADMKAKP